MLRRRALVSSLTPACFLLASPAWAWFDEGVAAHNRGDYAAALRGFLPLAQQGHAGAQYSLGLMYASGRGVPQDECEALKWFRLAGAQGVAGAQYSLGVMYASGQVAPQDYVQAHMWSTLAASRLSPGKNRDTAVKNRDIVAQKMTPAQLAEAQRLAREWKPKSGK